MPAFKKNKKTTVAFVCGHRQKQMAIVSFCNFRQTSSTGETTERALAFRGFTDLVSLLLSFSPFVSCDPAILLFYLVLVIPRYFLKSQMLNLKTDHYLTVLIQHVSNKNRYVSVTDNPTFTWPSDWPATSATLCMSHTMNAFQKIRSDNVR